LKREMPVAETRKIGRETGTTSRSSITGLQI